MDYQNVWQLLNPEVKPHRGGAVGSCSSSNLSAADPGRTSTGSPALVLLRKTTHLRDVSAVRLGSGQVSARPAIADIYASICTNGRWW